MSYFLKNYYLWFYYTFIFFKKMNKLNLWFVLKILYWKINNAPYNQKLSIKFFKFNKIQLKKTTPQKVNVTSTFFKNLNIFLINFFMDIVFFIFIFYFFLFNWYFYMRFIFFKTINFFKKTYETHCPIKNISLNGVNTYLCFIFLNFLYIILCLFFLQLNYDNIYTKIINFDNLNIYTILIWIFLNLLFFWTLKNLHLIFFFKIEYFFVICNIIFFFILLFLCNNLYTFLLLLEVCSYFFFYKLLLSNNFSVEFTSIKKNYEQYCSLIFYHYWVSTFSTFLYIFFFLILLNLYGSSHYGFLLFWAKQFFSPKEEFFFLFFLFGFIFCFFFKLGISPFHLFKFQIYENLSYIYIYFYTTYYFVGFFFIISNLIIKIIIPCLHMISFYFILFSIFFILFSSANLFYFTSFQQFLVLSTLINLLNLVLVLILYIS